MPRNHRHPGIAPMKPTPESRAMAQSVVFRDGGVQYTEHLIERVALALDAREKAAREEALEEAAREVDTWGPTMRPIAAAIRALVRSTIHPKQEG